ncbi:GntR family transcriptional regulator [Pseudovibrio exalbescens]|uniref:GntR family transcriptional regulator n=1 Tax=Pseudovibrio exalbescens TaxID=197461 RepID=UPI0023668899|nr:GntR family transcriptional regulator [Pseudovibrio exalbescens]MDD7909607.1 GntR family transcriptional regulator [Pseudovibrio exalbescens]
MSPRSSKKSRKSDFVYYGLKEKIIIGALKPGQVLGEQQIAAEYHCAQGTVREALIQLDNNGLVCKHDYRGTHVAPLCRDEALQMVYIRRQLEQVAARRVASKLSDEGFEELKLVVAAMHKTAADGRTYLCSEYDRKFHGLLFRESGLVGLEPILNRCALHMHRFTMNGRTEELDAEDVRRRHTHILEVYKYGTPDEAEREVGNHIDFLIETWMPDPLDL